ncbi:MAG: putative zinc-type alcohol dehydrogenase-like protein [Puniceicoccaceae bacterium 5H]|nr:MAG: putative zinc-type alcohol dehydrogenase-like protein [Puniceicoccaceae bacterium 5H]
MPTYHAYAAKEPKGKLEPFEYDPGPLGDDEVEIKVEYGGLCHSDLSMLNNDWGMSQYPFVPGHEIVGIVNQVGPHVKNVEVGQRVGLGWFSHSCTHCEQCMDGDHNLCPEGQGTIIGRHGGFADYVRGGAEWIIPLPDDLDAKKVGPLFCGGITVFNPIMQYDVRPTQRVGVIGIGGLGHLALQFLRAWGCEVTAFSHSPDKEAEAKKFGAHHFVNTKEEGALEKLQGSFDFILSTVNVELPWEDFLKTLRPKGRFHIVGAAPKVESSVMTLLANQLSIGATPMGSPATTATMLKFCERHNILPQTELYPMSQINEAFEHLEAGKARYRIVLEAGK